MHLIHLIYQASQFSLTNLQRAQNTSLAFSWQSHLTQSLFCNKVLGISRDVLNTELKVKNRMAVWVQNGCKCIDCSQLCLQG